MLSNCALGFGSVALATLLHEDYVRAAGAGIAPGGVLSGLHHPATAKSVIFLYMDGGPSQIDTFDYKPLLEKYHGQNPQKVLGKVEPTQFDSNGNMLASPWKFKQHGDSGHWISDLFPHVAEVADELAIVKSMTSNFSEHTSANYFLHTGNGLQGRPSMGSWVTYGLGSECQNLPGFITIDGGLIPPGGLDNFNSGFLPATYQSSIFKPQGAGVANAQPLERSPELQDRKRNLIRTLDQGLLGQLGPNDAVESAIANYELAARMQAAVPDLMGLKGETDATKKLYGLDAEFPQTRTFGTECLLARRMVERGVRFVELTCPASGGDRWDQHSGLKEGHTKNCLAVDQPIAGLLRDLKSRGLLDSTLVVWAGEFGRTPFAQGSDGRDHNPFGFTIWMAGGGAKRGVSYGATDDFGYKAVEGRQQIYDLHATMLYFLGVDHTKLTYRFSGRDMRLTDVHGELIQPLIG
ncbi:MAG TPA: DUF1501 domain-containing protein [Pirellulales bacterium]|nr:DUF1501 domain-containing protein [Pirellulales bacterium]